MLGNGSPELNSNLFIYSFLFFLVDKQVIHFLNFTESKQHGDLNKNKIKPGEGLRGSPSRGRASSPRGIGPYASLPTQGST